MKNATKDKFSNLLALGLITIITNAACKNKDEPQSELKAKICNAYGPNIINENLSDNLDSLLSCYHEQFKKWGIDLHVIGDQLITADGKEYQRIKFDSDFERDLALSLKDAERSKIIYNAYKNHLEPLLTSDYKSSIQWWIFKYSIFFAPLEDNIHKSNINYENKLSLHEELNDFNKGGKYNAGFKSFINEIVTSYGQFQPQPNPDKSADKTIVRIVTGPYGGGHISVANNLISMLKEKFNIRVIDECKEFTSPLSIATNGRYHSCLIYNDIEIRENDKAKGRLLSHLSWILSHYIQPNQRGALRELLAKEKTELVISSVHHITDIPAVGYAIGRPTFVIITDYSFPEPQYFALDHVSPLYVNYMVPDVRREFFRPMIKEYRANNWTARVKGSRINEIYNFLFVNDVEALTKSMLKTLAVISYQGFPVNQTITYPKDNDEIIAAKKLLHLNLDDERKVVPIAFGAAADPDTVLKLLGELIDNKEILASKVQLAIVTGGNQLLINRSKEFLNKQGIPIIEDNNEEQAKKKYPNLIIAKVLDRLSYPTDMSNLYKASDAFLSKAGGATTAELIASSTYYVRAFGLWPWEIENALLLSNIGLSTAPIKLANPLDINYEPYSKDPSGSEILKSLNEVLAKPRLLTPTTALKNFDADNFSDQIKKACGKI